MKVLKFDFDTSSRSWDMGSDVFTSDLVATLTLIPRAIQFIRILGYIVNQNLVTFRPLVRNE